MFTMARKSAATSTSPLKISTARRRLAASGSVSQSLCPAKTWPVETTGISRPYSRISRSTRSGLTWSLSIRASSIPS